MQFSTDSAFGPIVTDEDPDDRIEANIIEMARQMDEAIQLKSAKPALFPAVGGHKVLRDLVFNTRFVFREDCRFYKKHGLFDYPQKDIARTALVTAIYYLMDIPGIRKAFEKRMAQGQLTPLKKVLDRVPGG
jgi:hypothetical protein